MELFDTMFEQDSCDSNLKQQVCIALGLNILIRGFPIHCYSGSMFVDDLFRYFLQGRNLMTHSYLQKEEKAREKRE